jgi:transmembrane sensor
MRDAERFSYLLSVYVAGELAGEELNEFFGMVGSNRYDDLLDDAVIKDLKRHDETAADLPPHIAHEIIRNIYVTEKNTAEMLPAIRKPAVAWKWMAAASVFLAVCFTCFLVLNNRSKPSFVSLIPEAAVNQHNSGTKAMELTLDDGSVVTLSAGSTLHYPRNFTGDNREVYLEGEAFFNIAHNPHQPFVVYANAIVTKVLGTSFNIKNISKLGDMEVSVHTGKVQVFENTLLSDANLPAQAVIVTPNQKAVYKKDSRSFETTLVEQPQPLAFDAASTGTHKKTEEFVFEHQKLSAVFEKIARVYGIEIVTENSRINNCVFTGDVSANDLYTKLQIICLTVNASYQINGTKILIKGSGCN